MFSKRFNSCEHKSLAPFAKKPHNHFNAIQRQRRGAKKRRANSSPEGFLSCANNKKHRKQFVCGDCRFFSSSGRWHSTPWSSSLNKDGPQKHFFEKDRKWPNALQTPRIFRLMLPPIFVWGHPQWRPWNVDHSRIQCYVPLLVVIVISKQL